MEVDALEALGDDLDASFAHRGERGLGQRLHLDEPLDAHERLDNRAAALAGADREGVRLGAGKVAGSFEVGDKPGTRLVAIKAGIGAALLVDGGVLVHHVDEGKAAALTHVVVVRVVRGRDLDRAGAEVPVDGFVGDDRDATTERGQERLAAD